MTSPYPLASKDLIWSLTKNTSCYLYKGGGRKWDKHPNNLMNINIRKFSGLANNRVVAIDFEEDSKHPTLIKSRARKTNKPAERFYKIPLGRHMSNLRPKFIKAKSGKNRGKNIKMGMRWRKRGRTCLAAQRIEQNLKRKKDKKTGKLNGVKYRPRLLKFAIARYHRVYKASKVNVEKWKEEQERKRA